jgi:hypothetical protein
VPPTMTTDPSATARTINGPYSLSQLFGVVKPDSALCLPMWADQW